MILIVGLGNPGKKYQNNRHNIGHMFVDFLQRHSGKAEGRIQNLHNDSGVAYAPQNDKPKIVKTDCFMNVSGIFINKLIRNLKLEIRNLIVIHDDLDIPFGKFHIQFASGPQLHNGLESIEQHLKTKDFWRVRIGVDARLPNQKIPGETYSLQNFLSEEKKLLEVDIFPKIFTQLKVDLKNQFKVII